MSSMRALIGMKMEYILSGANLMTSLDLICRVHLGSQDEKYTN
jgi:hypothetical protein